MLQSTLVTNINELQQIHALNQQYLKQNISATEKEKEGFVTWLYPLQLLQQMQDLAPTVIVKDDEKVVGYALTTLKQARRFHPDLDTMMQNLQTLLYKNQPLFSYSFYCMGQICIEKSYRGKGLFQMLYQKHKDVYSNKFDLLVTEVSTSNPRSMRAHEKVGFQTIHTYKDAMDEWNVVVWDWKR